MRLLYRDLEVLVIKPDDTLLFDLSDLFALLRTCLIASAFEERDYATYIPCKRSRRGVGCRPHISDKAIEINDQSFCREPLRFIEQRFSFKTLVVLYRIIQITSAFDGGSNKVRSPADQSRRVSAGSTRCLERLGKLTASPVETQSFSSSEHSDRRYHTTNPEFRSCSKEQIAVEWLDHSLELLSQPNRCKRPWPSPERIAKPRRSGAARGGRTSNQPAQTAPARRARQQCSGSAHHRRCPGRRTGHNHLRRRTVAPRRVRPGPAPG